MIEATSDSSTTVNVESFIARWQGREGGAERANYALFLTELCDVLGVARPHPADASTERNDYVFERAVTFREAGDRIGHGRIDLYKRGSFVLEAKQSRQRGGAKEVAGQEDLFRETETPGRGRRGADRNWDVLMLNARRQAEDYARALPADHEWPPFILVCDVGHAIEVFADFTGKGRNYSQFPDRQGFRIYLEDLRRAEIRERLRLIWQDPHALDPTKRAARATREIAARLAEVSKALEKAGHDAEHVAEFLMRCVFTMFAEDVKLLPEGSFTELLAECEDKPEIFAGMLETLWRTMNDGGIAAAIRARIPRFNGDLFANARAYALGREEIGELRRAAEADWREVEPAIFGTLLEQALDPAERRRLGAHYTPRAYVERLVIATVIEPLRDDWRDVLAAAEQLKAEGDAKGAVAVVADFHRKLAATRVLDPACGTGNFLYVSLELMKRLEGEVLEALADLGGEEGLGIGHIDPHLFLGIEVNPRAAKIAELVLWIGYLQWHFRTRGGPPSEPILRAFHNIEHRDAVLTWDGAPAPKIVDGKETYPNARRPDWPEAEYIVGNPPFIGGKDVRARLGDGYAETLWKVHKHVNPSADFVMYWWDRAAEILARKGTPLRRFGFVTTNSITQVFQRRVVERHLAARGPISLSMAIPDHPWTKATRDAAAVRIAMTVAAAGSHDGKLREVIHESGLDTDDPTVVLDEKAGKINSDLTVGIDVTKAGELRANAALSSPGVKLHGDGFIVTPHEAEHLGLRRRPGLEKHIQSYRNGRDLTSHPRGVMVIDLFGLGADEVRWQFPEVYQHLAQTVRTQRQSTFDKSNTRDAKEYLDRWWTFGKPRQELRPALAGLSRYIVTGETMKHRIFQFLDGAILPDNMLVAIAVNEPTLLGILSSRIHVVWALRAGGWLGVGNDPRYSKSRCFDPFPFPDLDDPAGSEPARLPFEEAQKLKARIDALAEELDATRKRVLDEHPDLTLTKLYNVLERLRAIQAGDADATVLPLTSQEEDIRDHGLVLIIKELHDRIDAAVFEAYGWPADLSDEEILARLVALNKVRAAEEARGKVRWLRPDYQIPKFGTPAEKEKQLEAELVTEAKAVQKPSLPAGAVERTAAVFAALAEADEPMDATMLATTFKQGKRVEKQVGATLAALSRMGHLSTADGHRFSLRRAA